MKRIITVLMILTFTLTSSLLKIKAETFTSERSGFFIGTYGIKNEQGEFDIVKMSPSDPNYQAIYDRLNTNAPISIFFNESDQIAFCIEPHQSFKNETFETWGWNYRSGWVEDLETLQHINLIAFHGFTKEKQHQEDWRYWFAVTHQTIYQEMLAISKSDIPDYETSKQTILKDVSRHYLLPSFNQASITLIKEEPVVLTDNNEVMADISVTDSAGFDVTIDGQQLIIKANKNSPQNGIVRLTKYQGIKSSDPIIYTNPKTQDVMVPATPKPIPMTISVRQQQADTIIIEKVDENNRPIKDAIFQISKDKQFKDPIEVKTNDQGLTSIVEMMGPNETVYIREVYVPEPYLLSQEVKSIVLAETNHQITFTNKAAQGQIKVVKVDEANQPLADAVFEIRDSNQELVETIRTNEQGVAYTSLLPLATYFLQEVQAPKDYKRNQEVIEINLSFEAKEVVEVTHLSQNQPIEGEIELHKYGEQLVGFESHLVAGYTVVVPKFEKKYLEGARFQLHAAKDIHRNQRMIYQQGDLVVEFTTKDEPYRIENLPLGKYRLTEVDSPNEYLKDEQIYEIDLSVEKASSEIVLETLELTNQRKQAKLSAQKSFEDSKFHPYPKDLMDSVLFGVRTKEDIQYGDFTLKKDSWVSIAKLNEKMELNLDLILEGSYQLVELSTHEAYQLLTKPIDFEVTFGETEVTEIKLKAIGNKLKKGRVKLIKEDFDNPDQKLSEVVFDLYRVGKPNQKVGTYKTDSNGEISLELQYGDYYFIEQSTLPGYLLEEKKLNFTLSDADTSITLNSQNQQTTTTFVKRDGESHQPLVGAHLRLLDSKGNLIVKWVSTDQPHPIRGLHFDEWYTLEETIAPASYQIAEVHRFKIAESGNSEIILDNYQYSIEVTVKKIDQVTAKPLEQAHFEIYDSHQKLIETSITDEEGLFSVLLKPGTYYLKEIQAPYGYQIDPELKEITITGLEPNQKLELVYENQLVPLPRTGPLSLYLGLGFAGMAMVVVGFIFLSRRK